jgi:biotin operon repressor
MRGRGKSFRLLCATVMVLGVSYGLAEQTADRIAKIDDTSLVRLTGNVSPRARQENDFGAVAGSFKLDYITLHLRSSAAQERALQLFLTQAQNPASPNYHQWLTPEQYADRFGLSRADIAKVSAWLRASGFTILQAARGRNWIAFRGDAGQVQKAFHTEIHRYVVDGETHTSRMRASRGYRKRWREE